MRYKLIGAAAWAATAVTLTAATFSSAGNAATVVVNGMRGTPFHSPHISFLPGSLAPRFLAGTRGRPCPVANAVRCFQNTGSVSEAYAEDSDDIDNLHFRVQEPFGPWDIGPQRDEPAQ